MSKETDVLLIGGGIMSATLGTWLQELEPDWSITMVEQMSSVAERELERMEQRGHRPRGADGIELYAANR